MLKYLIFLVNFVIFVTGCVVFGFGLAIHLKVGEFSGFVQDSSINSSIVLMVAGGVILLVTFFGCCGTCTENPCMLYTFGTLLALILLVEIGAIVTAVVFKGQAAEIVSEAMNAGLKEYNKDEGTQKAWDSMQTTFQCCGVDSYQDWNEALGGSVPDSCCLSPVGGCGQGVISGNKPDSIHTEGCLNKFTEFISSNVVIVGAIAGAVVVLQLIGIIVVCCLANRMREDKQYV